MTNLEEPPLELPTEVYFGAWRRKQTAEKIPPQHTVVNGAEEYVPVRAYGVNPPKVPIDQKMSPMPLPISSKIYE